MKINKIFHSIYFKFVIRFIFVFFLATSIAIGFAYRSKIGDIRSELQTGLEQRLSTIRTIVSERNIPLSDTISFFDNSDIETTVFSTVQELNKKYRLSDYNVEKLENGEIVSIDEDETHKMPFSIALIDNSFLVTSPNLVNNSIYSFVMVIQTIFFLIIVIGSVFVTVTVSMIIKPIKKLTNASKQIASGDFDVELKVKGNDEIADLLNNFNTMAEELKSNEYLHKDFVSSVSHEFKTPISSLKGFAKLIKDTDLQKEQVDEYADIIISESDRLSNLSSNLLKLAELDNEIIKKSKTTFFLDEQLRKVIVLLQEKWEAKNIEIVGNLEKVQYTGNEDLLQQVWINLISNAIKFTNDGGKININLKKREKLIIEISDTGIGIAESEKDKIFDRFYKVDKSRSKEGTGLGLSIVKKVVQMHDGKIWLESKEGEGSIFYIELNLI